MSYTCHTQDGIITFTFHNGKVNAITTETLKGLEQAVDKLNADQDLKGLILTGAGTVFTGGYDLGTFTSFASDEEIRNWFQHEEEVLLKLFTCTKPVVAAVNGHAIAAGMILVMASDYRIALHSDQVKIGMPEIKLGMSLTPAEGEIMLFGLGTDKNFRDIIMKGEFVTPAYCLEQGIIDEVAPVVDELIARARAKICALYDTPGHPFMGLKSIQKNRIARWIREGIDNYNWDRVVKTFTNTKVVGSLKRV